MGPYQRTPKEVARAIRYSGLEVRSVGPVGDFVDINKNDVPKNHCTLQKNGAWMCFSQRSGISSLCQL